MPVFIYSGLRSIIESLTIKSKEIKYINSIKALTWPVCFGSSFHWVIDRRRIKKNITIILGFFVEMKTQIVNKVPRSIGIVTGLRIISK